MELRTIFSRVTGLGLTFLLAVSTLDADAKTVKIKLKDGKTKIFTTGDMPGDPTDPGDPTQPDPVEIVRWATLKAKVTKSWIEYAGDVPVFKSEVVCTRESRIPVVDVREHGGVLYPYVPDIGCPAVLDGKSVTVSVGGALALGNDDDMNSLKTLSTWSWIFQDEPIDLPPGEVVAWPGDYQFFQTKSLGLEHARFNLLGNAVAVCVIPGTPNPDQPQPIPRLKNVEEPTPPNQCLPEAPNDSISVTVDIEDQP